jgi:hypothetical protein
MRVSLRNYAPARAVTLGWILVCVASLGTLVLLGTAGRLPGADLPQHALYLRRVIEGGDASHEVRWVTPYTLLFVIAWPIAKLSDPAQAIWCTTAFAVALLPIASATLASALRRAPALGLFAYLGAFSSVVAWGFSSMVLGVSIATFAIAAALHYARTATAARGVLVMSLIMLAYTAHPLPWSFSLLGCLSIVLVRRRRLALRELWPIAVAGVCTGVLFAVWKLGQVPPWEARSITQGTAGTETGWLARLVHIANDGSTFGRTGSLALAWLVLAGLALCVFVHSLRVSARARARLARLRSTRSMPATRPGEQLTLLLRRHDVTLAWLMCLVAYLMVPTWAGKVFLAYPRALVFCAVLTPGAAFARRTRFLHTLSVLAFVPALALVLLAGHEARVYAEATKCVEVFAKKIRKHENLLVLFFNETRPEYAAPVDDHIDAELVARRGGSVADDFTDLGEALVTYRHGYDRLIVGLTEPPGYVHRVHGREFTAWLLSGVRSHLAATLTDTFGSDGDFLVHHCGPYALVIDRSVPAGSRRARVFLPHFHAGGQCSVAAHAAELKPPSP